MMYEVVVQFADLKDKEHVYRVGDEFPRPGIDVSEERIKELETSRNRIGKPLIRPKQAEIKAESKPASQSAIASEKRKRGRKKAE